MNRALAFSPAGRISSVLVLAILTFHFSGCASKAFDACSQEIPPLESRRLVDAGNIGVVVFPAELPENFEGCQRSWAQFDGKTEHSFPSTDTFFAAGRPTRLIAYGMNAGRTIVSDCRYVEGALDDVNSVRPSSCPSFSMLMDTARARASVPGDRIR